MIRTLFVVGLLAATAMPANAQLLGDFDCVSDLKGRDTPAGLLRIDEPTSFGFLNADARVHQWYPVDLSDPDNVNFDDAFADHISAGAIMIDARMVEDEYSYYARILTKKGGEISVFCPCIY